MTLIISKYDLVFEATKFAVERHRDQKRGGRGQPYVNHTIEVARLIASHGITSPETLAAAILHDVVEDTYPATAEGMQDGFYTIDSQFGTRVKTLVEWLTLPIDARAWQVKTKHQIKMMETMDDDGRAIKIADKMNNVGDLVLDPPKWDAKDKLSYANSSREVVQAVRGYADSAVVFSLMRAFDETYIGLTRSLTL